jgi:hypothetical protein
MILEIVFFFGCLEKVVENVACDWVYHHQPVKQRGPGWEKDRFELWVLVLFGKENG